MSEIAALVQQASDGDPQALRTLLETGGQQVWQAIDADIGSRWRSLVDADDVMQVTYMEAFLQVEHLSATDEAGFVAWLRRIAKNNLKDAIRELSRKKRPSPALRVSAAGGADDSYVALVDLLGEESATPSRHVARQEAAEMIDLMLSRLPEDYAQVIRLYDLEGKPIEHVAGELGRSAGAVHMLRARAHDRLRGLLGAETDFFTRVS